MQYQLFLLPKSLGCIPAFLCSTQTYNTALFSGLNKSPLFLVCHFHKHHPISAKHISLTKLHNIQYETHICQQGIFLYFIRPLQQMQRCSLGVCLNFIHKCKFKRKLSRRCFIFLSPPVSYCKIPTPHFKIIMELNWGHIVCLIFCFIMKTHFENKKSIKSQKVFLKRFKPNFHVRFFSF